MKYPATNRPEVDGWYWVKDRLTWQTRFGWHVSEVFKSLGKWRARGLGQIGSDEIDGTETFYGPIELPDEAHPRGVPISPKVPR